MKFVFTWRSKHQASTTVKGNIMELSTNFLFEHELEIRLVIAVLAIIGGYGLVKLYTLIAEARNFVMEAYRKSIEAKRAEIPSIRTSAAGAR